MKHLKTILIVVILAFLAFHYIKGILYPPEPETIIKPVYIPKIEKVLDTVYLDSIVEKKIIIDNSEVIIDSTYYAEYLKAKEENDRLKLFLEAIKINDTTLTLVDDENVKIDVYSKNRGTLLEQSGTYTIKEKTIDVEFEVPVKRFRVYGGGKATIPTTLGGRFSFGPKLEVIHKDKTIYSGSVDTEGNITLGVTKSLFNIK